MLSKEGAWDIAFIAKDLVLRLYFATLKDASIVEIMEP
jgi:hypothetical protein